MLHQMNFKDNRHTSQQQLQLHILTPANTLHCILVRLYQQHPEVHGKVPNLNRGRRGVDKKKSLGLGRFPPVLNVNNLWQWEVTSGFSCVSFFFSCECIMNHQKITSFTFLMRVQLQLDKLSKLAKLLLFLTVFTGEPGIVYRRYYISKQY